MLGATSPGSKTPAPAAGAAVSDAVSEGLESLPEDIRSREEEHESNGPERSGGHDMEHTSGRTLGFAAVIMLGTGSIVALGARRRGNIVGHE